MRLSMTSPTFRIMLAVPFLAAILAFPAAAEPNPNSATPQVEVQTETGGTAPSATGEAKAGTTESTPEGQSSEPNGSTDTPDAAAAPPAEPKSSVVVNIDKSTQEMTVFVDGVEKYSWPVSTGLNGYTTPSGSYTASSMNKIWYSKQWDNAPMPHAVFFTKQGHAIHGTMEERNLGKPASHGCVRLSRANAATLFALVEENGLANTQIVLTGYTPGGEGPKVASPGKQPRGYAYGYPPWFDGGQYYVKPNQQRRRGLFGRRWFAPQQGYYGPRGNYYVGPRGY
jgi:lipoprotein-anchoring transpeptidase ErfK/SrfK